MRSHEDIIEEMAHAASHDLREPLRMVAMAMLMLERRHGATLPPDAREFMDMAKNGADRMDAMLAALVAYGRVGRVRRPEDIDLDALVQIRARRLCPELAFTKDPLGRIHADPDEMRTVLDALLDNARRFDASRIHVGRNDGFFIADDGIGIPPDRHERAFGLYGRLHPRERDGGLGIGLALARRIVEDNGGTIGLGPGLGGAGPGTTVQIHWGNPK